MHNSPRRDIDFNGDYMKKALLPLPLILILIFTACSQSQSVNLFQFTENFNRCEGYERIKMSDYLIKDREFTLFLKEDTSDQLLTVEETEEGQIKKIRLTVGKTDDNGKFRAVTDSEAQIYLKNAVNMLSAFSLSEKDVCEKALTGLIPLSGSAFSKTGELTSLWEHFSLVYYSNELCCQLWITDNYLQQPESTSKPVSRPLYGQTANIRED